MKFSEIKHDYIWGPLIEKSRTSVYESNILAGISIDAWQTASDDEPGTVVANVILTQRGDIIVDFHDNGVRMDKQVLSHISEAKEELRKLWAAHSEKRRSANPQIAKLGCTALLTISREELDRINGYLNADSKDAYQGEDSTITNTVRFPDGKEMDIRCCGCRDEASWTEAVLFGERVRELCRTEPSEGYEGVWNLEHDGVDYTVTVVATREKGIDTDEDTYSASFQSDEEGVCPLRGAEIEYDGPHDIDDDGGTVPWECPKCGASGKEGYNRVFDQHYEVCDAAGNPVPGREANS